MAVAATFAGWRVLLVAKAIEATVVTQQAQLLWNSSRSISLIVRDHATDTMGTAKVCRRYVRLEARPRQQALVSMSRTFRCFSQEAEAGLPLVAKSCTACSSKDLRPMTRELADVLSKQIPGWALLDVDGHLQLQKSWKAKNFVKGLELMKSIGDLAESEGHHPDFYLVNWNHVTAIIATHSIGGLSENDFILAAKIDALKLEGFLRKGGSKSAPKASAAVV